MQYLMESKTKNTAQPQFERLEYPQQFLLVLSLLAFCFVFLSLYLPLS